MLRQKQTMDSNGGEFLMFFFFTFRVDDELLGGEDEIDDIYDITNEREEALLQEEDEYSKSRDGYDNRKKSESYSENEEPDDVLNLDVEEDFQDDGTVKWCAYVKKNNWVGLQINFYMTMKRKKSHTRKLKRKFLWRNHRVLNKI